MDATERKNPCVILTSINKLAFCFSSTTQVDISDNFLENLPVNYIRDVDGVEFVDLSRNNFRFVPATIITKRKLKWLRMSDNNFKSIESGTFQNFKSLLKLNLTRNKITELRTGSFLGLERLEYLFLNQNNISDISETAFAELVRIQKIDLSKNKISELHQNTFGGLSSLRYLDLSENLLKTIPNNLFQDLGSLKNLDLKMSEIKVLSEDSFAGLTPLYSLSLQQNRINRLPDGLFKDLLSVGILQLHHNDISSFSNSAFQNNNAGGSLLYLHLGSEKTNSIDLDFLSQFPRLKVLDLTGSSISSLPVLRFCPDLEVLSISHTNIARLYPCDLGNF